MTRGGTPRGNVTRAAKMLDKEVPRWYRLVQPEKLVMADCSNCVLGQLFGRAVEEQVETIIGCRLPPLSRFPHSFARGERFLNERGRDHARTGSAFSSEEELKCWWVEEIAERVAKDEQDTNQTA